MTASREASLAEGKKAEGGLRVGFKGGIGSS